MKPSPSATIEKLSYMRDVPPAHYMFKIESFSLLSKTHIEKYESGCFEASGYNWRLTFYPNGNKKRNGDGHISLYLEISDTEKLPVGWQINVEFKLFVYDQIRDKYLVTKDAEDSLRRFNRVKTEWGFAQLLPQSVFNDASNGYLIDDCCIFGAEVFVIKDLGKGHCLSMTKNPVNSTYTWKINNFSMLSDKSYYSDVFTVEDVNWKLRLYPKGYSSVKNKSLSLFLETKDCATLPAGQKIYAEFKVRIEDQLHGNHREYKTEWCFRIKDQGFGFLNFMSLKELNNTSKGYLLNDSIIIEAQIIGMSVLKDF